MKYNDFHIIIHDVKNLNWLIGSLFSLPRYREIDWLGPYLAYQGIGGFLLKKIQNFQFFMFPIFGLFGYLAVRKKHGQVGYPWKGH